MTKLLNVLFLCTGNSARSIIAEALINRWGAGRFFGYSAGSQPKGVVHPLSLRLLTQMNFSTVGYRSKSWEEFTLPGAPNLDFVFTVCDSAASESCPVWPGQPISGHWGVPDPAAAEGSDAERMQAFRDAFRQLENRIKIFTSLPLDDLDRVKLQAAVNKIGEMSLDD